MIKTNNDKIYGYKAFIDDEGVLRDFVNRNEVCKISDATNKVISSGLNEKDLNYGENGFHYCMNINDCMRYIGLVRDASLVVCQVESDIDNTKLNSFQIDSVIGFVCSEYKILKVMTQEDLKNHALKQQSQGTMHFVCDTYPWLLKEETLKAISHEMKRRGVEYYAKYFSNNEMQNLLSIIEDKTADKKEPFKTRKEEVVLINNLFGYFTTTSICDHIIHGNNKLGKTLFNRYKETGDRAFRENLSIIAKESRQYYNNEMQKNSGKNT